MIAFLTPTYLNLVVVNESSDTTKSRVVFDGLCLSSSGNSFDDIRMVGPPLQSNVFAILVQFRQDLMAFSVDI